MSCHIADQSLLRMHKYVQARELGRVGARRSGHLVPLIAQVAQETVLALSDGDDDDGESRDGCIFSLAYNPDGSLLAATAGTYSC